MCVCVCVYVCVCNYVRVCVCACVCVCVCVFTLKYGTFFSLLLDFSYEKLRNFKWGEGDNILTFGGFENICNPREGGGYDKMVESQKFAPPSS